MPSVKRAPGPKTPKTKSRVSKSLKMPSAELKFFDVNQAIVAIPAGLATNISTLNLVAQGTGPRDRVGRQFTVKSIDIKINLGAQWAIPAAVVPNVFSWSYRVDLFLDKQCNGALPLAADMYDTTIGAVAPTNRFLNTSNEARFQLLKRWEGDLNPPSAIPASAVAAQSVQMSRDLLLHHKLNHRIEMGGIGGLPVIADVRSNNLVLVFSADNQVVANTLLQINTADTRIRFVDS